MLRVFGVWVVVVVVVKVVVWVGWGVGEGAKEGSRGAHQSRGDSRQNQVGRQDEVSPRAAPPTHARAPNPTARPAPRRTCTRTGNRLLVAKRWMKAAARATCLLAYPTTSSSGSSCARLMGKSCRAEQGGMARVKFVAGGLVRGWAGGRGGE